VDSQCLLVAGNGSTFLKGPVAKFHKHEMWAMLMVLCLNSYYTSGRAFPFLKERGGGRAFLGAFEGGGEGRGD
jgi:hypothetical protein